MIKSGFNIDVECEDGVTPRALLHLSPSHLDIFFNF